MSHLRQVALEHVVLFSLMLLSSMLIVPLGLRAVPVAVAAWVGIFVLLVRPAWAYLFLLAWCLLTFGVRYDDYLFKFSSPILATVPLVIHLVLSWIWWQTGRAEGSLASRRRLWQYLGIGLLGTFTFSSQYWLGEPREPIAVAALMAFFLLIFQIVLLASFWARDPWPAMTPLRLTTWLVGWYLSYFLVEMQDGFIVKLPAAVTVAFFVGSFLVQASAYRTLAREFHERRGWRALYVATVTIAVQMSFAVFVFWRVYLVY